MCIDKMKWAALSIISIQWKYSHIKLVRIILNIILRMSVILFLTKSVQVFCVIYLQTS